MPSPAYAIASNVLIRRLKEEAVLLDLDAGEYYGLDDLGVRLVEHLTGDETGDLQALAERLSLEFDAEAATIHTDLVSLTEELLQARLLTTLAQ